jgi:hypothetical protein
MVVDVAKTMNVGTSDADREYLELHTHENTMMGVETRKDGQWPPYPKTENSQPSDVCIISMLMQSITRLKSRGRSWFHYGSRLPLRRRTIS